MEPDELKARARRIAQELVTQGDLAVAAAVYARGCCSLGTEGAGTTPWIAALRRGFSDLRAVVEDEVAEGDTVAQRLTLAGTHDGPFLGIPPTGREIELRFVVFVSFRDGLMAGERFYYDLTGLLRQLGVSALPAVGEDARHEDAPSI